VLTLAIYNIATLCVIFIERYMPIYMNGEVKRRKNKRLRELGIRKDEAIVTDAVARLLDGEKRWGLVHGSNAILSQRIVYDVLPTLITTGKLNFLFDEHEYLLDEVLRGSQAPDTVSLGEFKAHNPELVDDVLSSRKDPPSLSKYKMMARYEELIPEGYLTIKHLRSIGINDTEAVDMMVRYDELKTYRDKAVIYPFLLNSETNTWTKQPGMIPRFPRLNEYLRLLFNLYCRTEYPQAPQRFVGYARELRLKGEMEVDSHLVTAGEDILRYQIWESNVAENAYYRSLKRLKTTKKTHDRFVEDLKNYFYSGKEVPNG
jgi:hypothetical protein